jgi:hypothetical protein
MWGCGFQIWTPFRTRKVKKCPTTVKSSIGVTDMDLTISMEFNPSWEAASCAVTQAIPNILWHLKVHYHVHKAPLVVLTLSQINPVHNIPFYLSNICLNIHNSGLFLSGFPIKILSAFLFCLIHATCHAHLILRLIVLIVSGKDYN